MLMVLMWNVSFNSFAQLASTLIRLSRSQEPMHAELLGLQKMAHHS